MKVNLREIIHYIDESTLEKAKNEKVQKQESPSKMSKDVEESVDKMFSNRMSKAYSEWKSNQDTQSFNENIEKEYQKLWCGFFDSVAIEARKNPKLQSQNIPKRFWKDTVELASGK